QILVGLVVGGEHSQRVVGVHGEVWAVYADRDWRKGHTLTPTTVDRTGHAVRSAHDSRLIARVTGLFAHRHFVYTRACTETAKLTVAAASGTGKHTLAGAVLADTAGVFGADAGAV